MKEPYPTLNRTIKQKRRRHPYKVSYNKRCLKPDCEYPSFFDGETYFSLCLKHLEIEQLGPFFNGRKYDPSKAEPSTTQQAKLTQPSKSSKAQPSITKGTKK